MVLSYKYICCPTVGNQPGAPDISNVLAQVREEATEAGCYGDGVTDDEILLVIWDTAVGSYLAQVLGTEFFVLQQQLDGSRIELTAGAGKVGRTGEVLGTLGEDRRMVGRFCVAVVQEVILFGAETWVMTPQL